MNESSKTYPLEITEAERFYHNDSSNPVETHKRHGCAKKISKIDEYTSELLQI